MVLLALLKKPAIPRKHSSGFIKQPAGLLINYKRIKVFKYDDMHMFVWVL